MLSLSAPPNLARVCEARFPSMGWSFEINSVFQSIHLYWKGDGGGGGGDWGGGAYLKGVGLIDY